MARAPINIVLEGPSDEPVVRKILRLLKLEPGPIYLRGGKSQVDRNLAAYNQAARHAPWLIVRDLDQDEPCAAALVARLLPHPSPQMYLRVAVREVEAWLIGDREALGSFLGIPRTKIPAAPEVLENPKQALINLARLSKRGPIRRDMVPEEGTTAQIGPGYIARIGEYALEHWRPEIASDVCSSLSRCLAALRRLG